MQLRPRNAQRNEFSARAGELDSVSGVATCFKHISVLVRPRLNRESRYPSTSFHSLSLDFSDSS
jgi:hypothetical protein